jgi:hypothetical protein
MGIPLRVAAISLSLSLSLSRERERERAVGIAFYDRPQKPHSPLILDSLAEHGEENFVINAIEEFSDVAFQDEAIAQSVPTHFPYHRLQTFNATMRSVPNTARERCRNERLLENRVQDGEDGVVQDAVADEGLVNVPLFRIVDVKAFVRPVPIRFVPKLPVQLKNVCLKIALEPHHVRLVPLPVLENGP